MLDQWSTGHGRSQVSSDAQIFSLLNSCWSTGQEQDPWNHEQVFERKTRESVEDQFAKNGNHRSAASEEG